MDWFIKETREAISKLEKRIALLEKCPHTSIVSKYTKEGFSNRCRKCDEEISFEPRQQPDFNNYEVG